MLADAPVLHIPPPSPWVPTVVHPPPLYSRALCRHADELQNSPCHACACNTRVGCTLHVVSPLGPVPEYAAQAASSAPPHHSTVSALDALAQRRYERPEGLDRCALLGADRLGVRLQREDRGAARLAAAAHARTPASAVYSVCAQAPQAQACVLHGTSGRPCAQQAQEGSLPTSKGVTYLEVKWHMLMA